MSRQRHQRLEELFHQSLGIPAAEREALLAGLQDEDPDLATELKTLLEQDALEEDPTVNRHPQEPAPAKVGPFRIDRPIGEGGFAVVYLAHQEGTLQRPVALKILKPGFDSHTTLARFDSERKALAVMNHDGIARIYDAGTTDEGRPWFAMEFVDGLPITEYCIGKNLNTRQRLELFAEVCAAVNHAHQKGVIHRDLKPSNILVADHGDSARVKVIDFGIAKAAAMDDGPTGGFTLQGQFIGTPEYMSPEQAGFGPGDVDTRSDIYSLGVVLYELLTGLPPFSRDTLREAGLAEIQRMVREVDPPRPSTRLQQSADPATRSTIDHRALRSELDWVVLKAMDKDRERRYPSSAALDEDLRRFLRGEPLEARPPGRGYILRKFAARHRLGLTMVAALVLGAIGLAGGVTVAWQESRQRERDTAAALAEAEAVTDFLVDMIGASEPYQQGKDVMVRTVLDSTAAHIDEDLADQPLVAARVKRALGSAYHELGDLDRSVLLLRQVLRTHTLELGPDHEQSLTTQTDLANVLLRQDRNTEADSLYSDLVERYRRTLGETHPNTVAGIHQRGVAMWEMSRYDEAEPLLRRSYELVDEAFPDNPSQALSYANNLANFLGDAGQFSEAESLLRMVVEERIRFLGPEHPEVLEAWNNLAMSFADQGRIREGLPIFRRVLALQDKLLGPGHFEALITRHNLAAMQGLVFNWSAAETLRVAGVRLAREFRSSEERVYQFHLHSLGQLYLDMGRFAAAETLLTEAFELRLQTREDDHRDVYFSLDALGRLELARGNLDQAHLHLQAALEGNERNLGHNHPNTIGSRVNIARWLLAMDRPAEAREIFDEAVKTFHEVQGDGHFGTLQAEAQLVRSELATGQAEAGRRRLPGTIDAADSSLDQRDPMHAVLRLLWAACEWEEGNDQRADSLLTESLVRWDADLMRATPWPGMRDHWEREISGGR